MRNGLELIQGAIDLHCHFGPDTRARHYDAPQLVEHYVEAGLAGVLLKHHHFPTQAEAHSLRRIHPGFRVLSGIALNNSVGGINPEAVELAARCTVDCVFFPTIDAVQHRQHNRASEEGAWSVLDQEGRLTVAAEEAIALIARHRLIMATGHLSPAETLAVVRRGKERGVERMIVTHASIKIVDVPLAVQQEVAALGAIIEHCFISTIYRKGPTPMSVIAEQIRAVGPERCVINTDLGQGENIRPADGFAQFAEDLLAHGITEGEVRRMATENPRAIAG